MAAVRRPSLPAFARAPDLFLHRKANRHAGWLFTLYLFAAPSSGWATATVTSAAGGGSISSNAVGGAWMPLVGPSVTEADGVGIGTGTIVLNIPAGFEFDPASPVTATVTGTGGKLSDDLTLVSGSASTTATSITITVASASKSGRRSTITWAGIRVRPLVCSPLAAGNITKTGSSGYSEKGSAGNYGVLTEVIGAASRLSFIQQPSNVAAYSVVAPAITARAINQCGDAIPGVRSISMSLSSGTGSLMGTLTQSSDASGLATFGDINLDQAGVKTLLASSLGLTPASSGSFTVSAVSLADKFNAFETLTPSGSVVGVNKTHIAGTPHGVDVVALKVGGTLLDTSFKGDVRVEMVDASTGADCTSYGLIQTLGTITFAPADSGRKTLPAIIEGNAWRNVTLRMSYPATGAATVVECAVDHFAVRPFVLTIAASHATSSTPGDVESLNNGSTVGLPVHRAGRPFRMKATGYSSGGVVTSNYNGSPSVASVLAVAPATVTGAFVTGAFSAAGGTVYSDTATYSEAGSLNLSLRDDGFASIDAADSTDAERFISSAVAIVAGRFVPDHLDVTLNAPVFATGCGTGGFTYLAQPFSYSVNPVIDVMARNSSGGDTRNYTGSLWKITQASLTGKAYAAASGTLNTAGIPGVDPVIIDMGGGFGQMTFGSGTGLSFDRFAAPAAPFDAEIALSINVMDLDGVSYGSNPVQFGLAAPGGGVAFSGGKSMRYGRLSMGSVYGSELLDIPIPMGVQYWAGSYYTTNANDSCTTLQSADVALGNYQNNLNMGETSVSLSGALNAGVSNMKLTSPGAGNNGSVDILLSPVSMGVPWLGEDQVARAVFGVRGRSPITYMRENY